ncbi:hypothetical protein RYX36_023167 [Vicia faba]
MLPGILLEALDQVQIHLEGVGRAFAAGGDIVALYHFMKEGNIEACKELVTTVYSFIYLLGTYLKPHVALLNGITMGSGGGISIPGTFRVATDKTRLPLIEEQLGKLVTDDPSVIETTLEQYGDLVYPDSSSVLQRLEIVDKCFCHDTVEEIVDALIREGRFQTLDQCLLREYRMTLQAISKQISGDFCEGVRARMVDKDMAPQESLNP